MEAPASPTTNLVQPNQLRGQSAMPAAQPHPATPPSCGTHQIKVGSTPTPHLPLFLSLSHDSCPVDRRLLPPAITGRRRRLLPPTGASCPVDPPHSGKLSPQLPSPAARRRGDPPSPPGSGAGLLHRGGGRRRPTAPLGAPSVAAHELLRVRDGRRWGGGRRELLHHRRQDLRARPPAGVGARPGAQSDRRARPGISPPRRILPPRRAPSSRQRGLKMKQLHGGFRAEDLATSATDGAPWRSSSDMDVVAGFRFLSYRSSWHDHQA